MAYSEYLADRTRNFLQAKMIEFKEKKMMGGLCFMVNDKMCAGVVHDDLMARINPDIYEDSLKKRACKEMNFTGKPMKGFVFVTTEGLETHENLSYWLQLCLDFNPLAKKSGKKSKKTT